MTRVKLRFALIAAIFLAAPITVSAETEIPDNAAPMGTDPATGRDIYWVPVDDDADHVAALQGTIKSQELQIYNCERELRDKLDELGDNVEGQELFGYGTEEDFKDRPPRPAGWPKSKPDRSHNGREHLDLFDGLNRAGDFVVMNPADNAGPILVYKTVIPALKKRKETLQGKIYDCLWDTHYASWLGLSASSRGSFADFASD